MTKTTLKIDGMMCGHCEAHVNDAIRNAYKGAVKTMIFYHDENGNIIPVSMGDVVQY